MSFLSVLLLNLTNQDIHHPRKTPIRARLARFDGLARGSGKS
jgi:hypothetical protein